MPRAVSERLSASSHLALAVHQQIRASTDSIFWDDVPVFRD